MHYLPGRKNKALRGDYQLWMEECRNAGVQNAGILTGCLMLDAD